MTIGSRRQKTKRIAVDRQNGLRNKDSMKRRGLTIIISFDQIMSAVRGSASAFSRHRALHEWLLNIDKTFY